MLYGESSKRLAPPSCVKYSAWDNGKPAIDVIEQWTSGNKSSYKRVKGRSHSVEERNRTLSHSLTQPASHHCSHTRTAIFTHAHIVGGPFFGSSGEEQTHVRVLVHHASVLSPCCHMPPSTPQRPPPPTPRLQPPAPPPSPLDQCPPPSSPP